MEVLTLIMYDIENDRIRRKVAEDCKDSGLERVQYSVFRGPMTRTRRSELVAKLRSRLGAERGRFLIATMCERDAREIREYGNDMPMDWRDGAGVVAA
jgi:CRISPR-associated protein Cas2